MQHTQMATPATSADGTKTTKHRSVSLVKQYNTYYQQSSNSQRWNNVSSKPFGLEETQQQEKHSWALATQLSEQEQSDACPSQTSMTNKCLTSSAEQEQQWHHHQHHKHNCNHQWSFHPPRKSTATTETQTLEEQVTSTPAPTGGPQLPPKAIEDAPTIGISITSIGQFTNGHSTSKLSQQTNDSITTKTTPGR
jgi:hypothetical protein